jgi:ATP-binding cassette subfamily B protein RaxB
MALSGGQKQRVLLARALYRKPQVLFLDEAFDQMDLDLERRISGWLTQQAISVVLVTHRESAIVGTVHRLKLSGRTTADVTPG